jgi:hypothetical protein
MTKPNIQIDDLVREMTDAEYANYLAIVNEVAEADAQREAKAEARQSALVKLAALGLTEEEIGAL